MYCFLNDWSKRDLSLSNYIHFCGWSIPSNKQNQCWFDDGHRRRNWSSIYPLLGRDLVLPWARSFSPLVIKHETLTQCWCNVGAPSTMLARHWTNIGSTCRVYRVSADYWRSFHAVCSTRRHSKWPRICHRPQRIARAHPYAKFATRRSSLQVFFFKEETTAVGSPALNQGYSTKPMYRQHSSHCWNVNNYGLVPTWRKLVICFYV